VPALIIAKLNEAVNEVRQTSEALEAGQKLGMERAVAPHTN